MLKPVYRRGRTASNSSRLLWTTLAVRNKVDRFIGHQFSDCFSMAFANCFWFHGTT